MGPAARGDPGLTRPKSHWTQLAERRLALLVATAAAPITLLAVANRSGPWTILIIIGAWLAVFQWARAYRCPRCDGRYAAGWPIPYNRYCAHCGCPQFAPASLQGPFEATPVRTSAQRDELSVRWRRIVGATQATAGAYILLVGGMTSAAGPALSTWLNWSRLGFAALALLGGIALWRGDRAGFALTRIVLGAQVLGFVLPGAALELRAGLHATLVVSSVNVEVNAGWHSTFLAYLGPTTGWMVSLNLLALLLLTLIPAPPETAAVGRSAPHAVPSAES